MMVEVLIFSEQGGVKESVLKTKWLLQVPLSTPVRSSSQRLEMLS